MKTITLTSAGNLSLDDIQTIALDSARVELADDARARISLGRAVLDDALESGTRVYGLNTGLGHTRDVEIPRAVLDQYQIDIVIGHAAGIGDPLPEPEVRAIMASRLSGACRGYSGLSVATSQHYADMINEGVIPFVPNNSTIGASDLGTMAAVAAVMIGHGRAFYRGVKMTGAAALAAAGLGPVTLGPKEGLAVVSANSYSIGVGALALGEVARTLRLADIAAALSMEAFRSSLSPFDPEVSVARPFTGQRVVADNIRALLTGSYLNDPTQALSLQDALSIRTVAQVHGAAREQHGHAVYAVENELNGSGDNPMVSPDTKRAISTGNFHPMEIALSFEALRVALAHVAIIAERRISNLGSMRWAQRKGDNTELPADAVMTPGIGGYSYATLSSRIKVLANPVTLGIPTLDFGQEDHATAAPQAIDATREQLRLLDEVLVGEIALSAAILSWRDDFVLGVGTQPYYDVVIAASKTEDSDMGALLVAQVKPVLISMTSRAAHVLDEPHIPAPAPHITDRDSGKAINHELQPSI